MLAAVIAFYGLLGAGTLGYLWRCRTPIVASVHALHAPKLDKDAVWQLSAGSDVGVV